jgi:hypothetical protein
MKVIGLDDKEYNWPPATKSGYARGRKSELHERAYGLLKSLYPTLPIVEEVNIPGSSLRFDMVIPKLYLIIEVQGSQHDDYCEHFHTNKWNFMRAQANDNTKRNWCKQNNLTLIELHDGETLDEWRSKIENS